MVASGLARIDPPHPVVADDRFRLCSLTKPLTATAILQLVEAGDLGLDQPVARLLPFASPRDPAQTWGGVTVRHLLTHTSGVHRDGFDHVVEDGRPPDVRDLYDGQLEVLRPPGTEVAYSNHGFALLGLLIEAVTGVGFWDYLAASVLAPAGMTATGRAPSSAVRGYGIEGGALIEERVWETSLDGAHVGWTSAADVARFARALACGGQGDHARLLSEESVALMLTPQADVAAPGRGLGLVLETLDGRPIATHSGGWPGWSGAITIDPQRRLGAAALANLSTDARASLGWELARWAER